MTINSRF